MTTDNKNEFSFDELAEPFKKPEEGERDVFSFGEVPEPADTPDQAGPDNFSFDEVADPFKQPDQGETDVFSFGEVPEPGNEPDHGTTDDFSFFETPGPAINADHEDFSFGESPEPAGPDRDDRELFRFNSTECREFLSFTCQKCAAPNEVGFSQIQDEGLTATCSSCKASIEIVRDSCAKRASQLSRELYCAKCGHQLDHHILCPACGHLFPDYFVAINHEEARRQARNKRAARFSQAFADLGASIRSIATPGSSKEIRETYVPERHGVASEKPALLSKNLRAALIGLVIVVAAAAGGFAYYRQYKAEQTYVKDYIRALYGIKIGTEGSVSACAKIAEEWKATAESQVNFIPRVNADDEAKGDKVKGEVDKLMLKLQKAPPKYSQANAKLAELNTIYANLYSLKSSPRGTLDNFNSSADKANKAFKQTAQELKANLPGRLAKELEAGKLRYRGLTGL